MASGWTIVQRARVQAALPGTTLAASFASSVGAGNAVVALTSDNAVAAVSGIVGGGVTFVNAAAVAGTLCAASLWYGLNSSGGAGVKTVTVTWASTANDADLEIIEMAWSGGSTSACVVEASTAGAATNSGTGTAVSSRSITPTAGIDVAMFSATARLAGTYSAGPSAGFTRSPSSSAAHENATQLVQSTSGSYNCTWTMTNNYGHWADAIFALKGVTAGGAASAVAAPMLGMSQAVHRAAFI